MRALFSYKNTLFNHSGCVAGRCNVDHIVWCLLDISTKVSLNSATIPFNLLAVSSHDFKHFLKSETTVFSTTMLFLSQHTKSKSWIFDTFEILTLIIQFKFQIWILKGTQLRVLRMCTSHLKSRNTTYYTIVSWEGDLALLNYNSIHHN